MNNKHCVTLHSVLSKMPITTVAHNNDTCSKHPTDGCHLRPDVITLSTAAVEHRTEVLTAVGYIVSTVRFGHVSEDRGIFIFSSERVNALQYIKFLTHTPFPTHIGPVHTTSAEPTDTKHLATVWLLSSRTKFRSNE